MFDIDNTQVQELEKRLTELNARALPLATRAVLNKLAFQSRTEAQTLIVSEMVLRNKYTLKSIRVDQARGSNISAQQSVMGSTADYMFDQEYGGNKRRKSGKAVVIPTSFSAGLGRGAKPRTRMPRGALKMGSIAIQRAANAGANRRQRNVINIAASKGGFAYLDLGRRKGIFKIDKKGNPTMVHDLTRAAVRIPGVRWMQRSVDKVTAKSAEYWIQALETQLARLGP